MAGRDGSAIAGRRTRRATVVRAHRHHEGDQPARRAVFDSSLKDKHWDRGTWREISDGHCVADNLRKQVDEKRDRGRPLIDRQKAPLGAL